MSVLDTIFGRTRPVPSREEPLIALGAAAVSLEAELGLTPAGQAGIVLRHLDSAAFERAEADLNGLLELAARETGATIVQQRDDYGYHWVVATDDAIADLVSTVYSVALELRNAGFGDQVLAAVFGFLAADHRTLYWIYNFKRASFYPFAPYADGDTRDNAREIQASAAMEHELPIETDQSRWYALWAMPLSGAPAGRLSPANAHDGGPAPDHGHGAAHDDAGGEETHHGRRDTDTDHTKPSSHCC